jgi:hypothetical protein
MSLNLEASNSWNPQGLSRPVIGMLYLYLVSTIIKPTSTESSPYIRKTFIPTYTQKLKVLS